MTSVFRLYKVYTGNKKIYYNQYFEACGFKHLQFPPLDFWWLPNERLSLNLTTKCYNFFIITSANFCNSQAQRQTKIFNL